MTECECGCGQEANPRRRFIHGHNCKGKPLSEEHRKKISESLKGRNVRPGYKPTEETKKKISERMKGNTHACGIKHPNDPIIDEEESEDFRYDKY